MLLNNKLMLLSLLSISYLAPIAGEISAHQPLHRNGVYYHEPRDSKYEITFNADLDDTCIIIKAILDATQKCLSETEIKSINVNYDTNKIYVVLTRNCTPKLDDFHVNLEKNCILPLTIKHCS